MNIKTDSGKFRMALVRAGFSESAKTQIYNHVRSSTGHRRLKLWMADVVNDAGTETQHLLEAHLKALFGDRYLTGYFIPHPHWNCSLCIVLKD